MSERRDWSPPPHSHSRPSPLPLPPPPAGGWAPSQEGPRPGSRPLDVLAGLRAPPGGRFYIVLPLPLSWLLELSSFWKPLELLLRWRTLLRPMVVVVVVVEGWGGGDTRAKLPCHPVSFSFLFLSFFLSLKYILLIFLQRGRERDRELETLMKENHRSAASCTYWRCARNQGTCP